MRAPNARQFAGPRMGCEASFAINYLRENISAVFALIQIAGFSAYGFLNTGTALLIEPFSA